MHYMGPVYNYSCRLEKGKGQIPSEDGEAPSYRWLRNMQTPCKARITPSFLKSGLAEFSLIYDPSIREWEVGK